jgi:plasmid stability protein
MKTLTVTGIDDELHRKLAERAAANQRSMEEEALCCLRMTIAQDEAILNSIPEERWKEIEKSLGEALRETPTEFTEADKQKYRDLARGYLKT